MIIPACNASNWWTIINHISDDYPNFFEFWLRLGHSRVDFHDCEDVIRITAVKHRRGVYR